MKLLVVKTLSGLKPCYDSDLEIYSKIPLNETFEIEYKKKRNLRFHKKYFALLKLCYENQNDYRTIEDLRRDLIITSGRCDEVVNKITGEVYKIAQSISFANMDNVEFSSLYEDTKNIISKWLGINNQTIDEEIEQFY